ncbi:polymer biosynthesis protein, WecB/TagA/CpsF family [Butyrivibrio fibrisolvens]|uniref:Polymer biosynthesis protein, WecB/TagA/CpsF family n=1 Tax=Butyrivibrio fibrisolvens TaxID=831 RepID=A0A1H9Q588_BUTFI|nr:WecB/TagA/CpsF family glycosyltransferase [Butyrivibrio fibrisolvens]SER55607.1 polymer biosynthesis protein, WecB/TagA/CpsF family [Butyrivibrio fibrisolvens]
MQIESYLKRIYRRHTLLLDYIVLVVSYALALVSRYIVLSRLYKKAVVISTIYVTIGLMLIAFLTLITYAGKDRFKVVPQQGKAEVIFDVIRIQFLMLFGIVIYLFAAGWSNYVSRTVLGLFFVINMILDCLARLWYRQVVLHKISISVRDRHYLLVTDSASSSFAPLQVRMSHPDMKLDVVVIDKENIGTDKDDNKNHIMSITDLEEGTYIKAYIYLPASTQNEIFEIVRRLEDKGIPSGIILTALGDRPQLRNLSDDMGFRTLNYTAMQKKGNVLGVNYTISTISEAVFYIRHHLEKLRGQYICFSNVHTTVMAHDRKDVLEAENSSAFTFTDGAPVARALRHQEESDAVRLAGPDFMKEMLISSMDGKTSHYFYGSSEKTLNALKANIEKTYPGVVVKGYYSPPFRELTEEENQQIIDRINAADADIIWVGLGAPRQEKWMLEHKGKFRGIMMGVGAAFDFHAGTIKRAPKWMQMLSLEWFYRLLQDPVRLFKRYLVTNIRFLWLLIVDNKVE